VILWLLGCSEFVLHEPPPVPPADPPADDPDADYGDPPDWSTCTEGWFGQYFNLSGDDPAVEPAAVPTNMEAQDWWEDSSLAFRRFDASLDAGSNWWPVDEGLAGDPDYFAARWTAWVRVTSGGTMDVVAGADTIAWVWLNREQVAVVQGDAQTLEIPVSPGQFPMEVRFAQLYAGESGLRFRIAGGDVQLCYPDFAGG
jgi:hypothetical protein